MKNKISIIASWIQPVIFSELYSSVKFTEQNMNYEFTQANCRLGQDKPLSRQLKRQLLKD